MAELAVVVIGLAREPVPPMGITDSVPPAITEKFEFGELSTETVTLSVALLEPLVQVME